MLETFCLTHYSVGFFHQKLDGDTVMEIEVDPEYLRAEIAYGYLVRCMWRQGKKQQILQTLCHKLCHVLTNGVTKNSEQMTEHISRLLYKLYERRNL